MTVQEWAQGTTGIADIITQEMIDKAIGEYWRGTSGWCPFCGRKQ